MAAFKQDVGRKVNTCKFSYKESLDAVSRQRYNVKLALIGGVDPYENNMWSTDVAHLPTVEQEDIYEYLVHKISFYTRQQFKASKQLGAHNQLTSGWVKSIMSHKPQSCQNMIIMSEVHHSQSLNEKLLKPWVISQEDGAIVTAHCDCMAGIAESCTHVAALLFAVNATVRLRDSKTPTQMPATWIVPSKKDIIYSEAVNIDFSSSAMKKRQMDSLISGTPCQKKSKRKTAQVTAPSNAEKAALFTAIQSRVSGIKPSILSVIPQYQDEYVPFSFLPIVMTDLYSCQYKKENYKTIVDYCQKITDKISVCKEQTFNAGTKTREQLNSKLWIRLRIGRITASIAHQVCHTNPEKPSISLVNKICQPASKLQTSATQWGREHEKDALMSYSDKMQSTHRHFELEKCGLFINPSAPYLAASPDGKVTCSCHGTGCVEVKCPASKANMFISESCEDPNFCLTREGEEFMLKKTHPYFYQVQLQMFVTDTKYCDFVVWTTKQIVCIRITLGSDFINMMVPKLHNFFSKAVLPELVGHYFSCPDGRKPDTKNSSPVGDAATTSIIDSTTTLVIDAATTPVADATTPAPLYCYCKRTEDVDNMVACDNSECKIEWFHFFCVGVKNTPKGKWFCPDCRQLPQFSKQKQCKVK